MTHVKKITHVKNVDPRNPRKYYDPRKKCFDPRNPLNPRKNLTHATHVPMLPTLPRNPRDLADSKKDYFQKPNMKDLTDKKFWKTMKLFFSNKGLNSNKLMLKKQDVLMSDEKKFCHLD